MALTDKIRSKGGKAVAKKSPPAYCPKCSKEMGRRQDITWHAYLGHLGLHGLADRYFGGDIAAAQKRLRNNGLARQDPMPYNGAWPKYKPIKGDTLTMIPIIKNEYQLEKSLIQALVAQGHQERRDYLGMSSIGYCARQIYNDLLNGKPDEGGRMHWYAFAGNLWERSLIQLLGYEPATEQIEVVARFEKRFRGHVDHVLSDGTLIECKSTNWEKFQKLFAGPMPQHVDQVQMYLRHGGWERAFIIYAARDINHSEWTGVPIKCFHIRPDRARQDHLDAKAQMILEALDRGGPPPLCDCGWCRL